MSGERGSVVAEGASGQTYEAFGAYVRSQRQLAELSLRQAAELARISNPYLSQIEHGLALPSVTVINALAGALQVSADTLLLLAAGVPAGAANSRSAATEDAIRHDARLDAMQKRALLAVLTAFVGPPQPRPKPRPVDENQAPAAAGSGSPSRRTPQKTKG